MNIIPGSQAHPSASLIRRRLSLLLLRALVVVVVMMIVISLVLTGIAIVRTGGDNPFSMLSLPGVLEAYYQGHGDWQGVNDLFNGDSSEQRRFLVSQWRNVMLLDEQGRIIVENGIPVAPDGQEVFVPQNSFLVVPLFKEGVQVGSLVHPQNRLAFSLRLIAGFLLPVGLISVLLGILTLFIGLLLTSRVVNPLSEVIAASQAVASGDLAARVQVQGPDDLRLLTDSFNQMAGALERSQEERRSLLADIAHELRTPLTVIRGRLEGIVDGIYTLDEQHVAPVLEETYLLERLVEDLRLLTLAESRQLTFERMETDLGEIAGQAVGLFGAQANEKNIQLELQVQPGLPHAAIDPQRTAQVIGNLVSNALDFTPEHGHVLLIVRGNSEAVEVKVSDSGPGVPEQDLPFIFERFWRADKSRSRAVGGSGLGLAIARLLVEAQGGTVFADNQPGGGLCIGFRFSKSRLIG